MPLIPQFHILQPPRAEGDNDSPDPILLGFSDWVEALLIALKYKREISEAKAEESEDVSAEDAKEPKASAVLHGAADLPVSNTLAALRSLQQDVWFQVVVRSDGSTSARKRYYTCPLDQVSSLSKNQPGFREK